MTNSQQESIEEFISLPPTLTYSLTEAGVKEIIYTTDVGVAKEFIGE